MTSTPLPRLRRLPASGNSESASTSSRSASTPGGGASSPSLHTIDSHARPCTLLPPHWSAQGGHASYILTHVTVLTPDIPSSVPRTYNPPAAATYRPTLAPPPFLPPHRSCISNSGFMSAQTLLAHVRSRVTVDVDSMDPAVAARHAEHTKFSDMTSNQAIVYSEAVRPQRAHLFNAACAQFRSGSSVAQLPLDTRAADALDLLVCTICVHLSPSVRSDPPHRPSFWPKRCTRISPDASTPRPRPPPRTTPRRPYFTRRSWSRSSKPMASPSQRPLPRLIFPYRSPSVK